MSNFSELLATMRSDCLSAKEHTQSTPKADRAFCRGADYMHDCFLRAMIKYNNDEADRKLREISEALNADN